MRHPLSLKFVIFVSCASIANKNSGTLDAILVVWVTPSEFLSTIYSPVRPSYSSFISICTFVVRSFSSPSSHTLFQSSITVAQTFRLESLVWAEWHQYTQIDRHWLTQIVSGSPSRRISSLLQCNHWPSFPTRHQAHRPSCGNQWFREDIPAQPSPLPNSVISKHRPSHILSRRVSWKGEQRQIPCWWRSTQSCK